jgi:hypothetical protein
MLFFLLPLIAFVNNTFAESKSFQNLTYSKAANSYSPRLRRLSLEDPKTVEIKLEDSLIVKELEEAKEELKEQSRPLPCVDELRESIFNDQGLTEISKTLLLSSLDKLTYGRRNTWLSSLNPLIVTEPQLSNIRNVCPAESIALVLVTNGISNNIQEWLVYHLLMGIKKILIYEDVMHESIQESFRKAVVRHEALNNPSADWRNGRHISSYNFALQNYGAEYDWMGFIDVDEFIVLPQERCLASFLSNFMEFGGVVLQWRLFSPVGVPFHDKTKTSFEQYQYTVEDAKRHIKSIVQPKYVKQIHIHHAFYEEKWSVNFLKDRIDGQFNAEVDPTTVYSVAELRHFYMGDVQFALYEKVCGLSIERATYHGIRIDQFLNIFHDGSLRREISLPLTHNDLAAVMFNI